MKTLRIVSLLIAAALIPGSAFAQNASNASANSSAKMSEATASVVAGTASVLAVGASLAIVAIEKAGESVILVVKDASSGATVSIKASAKATGNVSMVAGTAVSVVASAAGYSLYAAGQLIAYIPNEIGKSLVHHSKISK